MALAGYSDVAIHGFTVAFLTNWPIVCLSFIILVRKPELTVVRQVLYECPLHLQRANVGQDLAVARSSKNFSMYRRWCTVFLVPGNALCIVKVV